MLTIKELQIPGYAKVIEAIDLEAQLHCYIAVHDCTLGPALGGVRIYPYAKEQDALNDVLRLSKAMTYKSAIVEDGLGGGKSVIIADPNTQKTEKLLFAFAEALNSLGGMYIAAEDVGTNTDDMVTIRKKSPYVAALPSEKSSGDPSRFTAWGVFQGIQAVSETLWKTQSLRGKKIAIQGLGSVGSKLAHILFWEGAELIISDIDHAKLKREALYFGATIVSEEDFFSVECDLLVPCALGGVLNDRTIPLLKCKAVAGAANNQLLEKKNGLDLMKRNILYAPDYVINAGGIINAAMEFDPEGYNPKKARDKVNHIYDTLLLIFERAEKEGKPTNQVADEIAEEKLKHFIGKRLTPISFSQIGQQVPVCKRKDASCAVKS